MGRIQSSIRRKYWGFHSPLCDCGVLIESTVPPCRPPRLDRVINNCSYSRRSILPVEFIKKVRKRNLRRIEPKEDDDGELENTKDEEGDDKASVSKFAGKKKGKAKKDGSNNALRASSFGLLGEGDDEDNEDSGITKRMLIMKNQDNEVAGFAPCEKQITELPKVGKDERALKVAKRKLHPQESKEA
ncbi:60S ribosomal L36-2-like [Olea europaea subsp. europaea]|uniref:60S ribosomal L36-2-like n=1 Tax=Olea europaea subsp. europaea TaxID=158383 RepID=A0A8S0VG46_OLEEU|nr:60S ribosomal L36-2-like [Olea europaea subsp. europaea]